MSEKEKEFVSMPITDAHPYYPVNDSKVMCRFSWTKFKSLQWSEHETEYRNYLVDRSCAMENENKSQ